MEELGNEQLLHFSEIIKDSSVEVNTRTNALNSIISVAKEGNVLDNNTLHNLENAWEDANLQLKDNLLIVFFYYAQHHKLGNNAFHIIEKNFIQNTNYNILPFFSTIFKEQIENYNIHLSPDSLRKIGILINNESVAPHARIKFINTLAYEINLGSKLEENIFNEIDRCYLTNVSSDTQKSCAHSLNMQAKTGVLSEREFDVLENTLENPDFTMNSLQIIENALPNSPITDLSSLIKKLINLLQDENKDDDIKKKSSFIILKAIEKDKSVLNEESVKILENSFLRCSESVQNTIIPIFNQLAIIHPSLLSTDIISSLEEKLLTPSAGHYYNEEDVFQIIDAILKKEGTLSQPFENLLFEKIGSNFASFKIKEIALSIIGSQLYNAHKALEESEFNLIKGLWNTHFFQKALLTLFFKHVEQGGTIEQPLFEEILSAFDTDKDLLFIIEFSQHYPLKSLYSLNKLGYALTKSHDSLHIKEKICETLEKNYAFLDKETKVLLEQENMSRKLGSTLENDLTLLETLSPAITDGNKFSWNLLLAFENLVTDVTKKSTLSYIYNIIEYLFSVNQEIPSGLLKIIIDNAKYDDRTLLPILFKITEKNISNPEKIKSLCLHYFQDFVLNEGEAAIVIRSLLHLQVKGHIIEPEIISYLLKSLFTEEKKEEIFQAFSAGLEHLLGENTKISAEVFFEFAAGLFKGENIPSLSLLSIYQKISSFFEIPGSHKDKLFSYLKTGSLAVQEKILSLLKKFHIRQTLTIREIGIVDSYQDIYSFNTADSIVAQLTHSTKLLSADNFVSNEELQRIFTECINSHDDRLMPVGVEGLRKLGVNNSFADQYINILNSQKTFHNDVNKTFHSLPFLNENPDEVGKADSVFSIDYFKYLTNEYSLLQLYDTVKTTEAYHKNSVSEISLMAHFLNLWKENHIMEEVVQLIHLFSYTDPHFITYVNPEASLEEIYDQWLVFHLKKALPHIVIDEDIITEINRYENKLIADILEKVGDLKSFNELKELLLFLEHNEISDGIFNNVTSITLQDLYNECNSFIISKSVTSTIWRLYYPKLIVRFSNTY